MKKRICMILISAILILCMVSPAMAASGLNQYESALLAKFTQVVTDWVAAHPDTTVEGSQYIAEATNVLNQVDLDEGTCADLSAAIDRAMELINQNGWSSREDLSNNSGSILGVVNSTANKYDMNVTVDVGNSDFATVTFVNEQGQQTTGGTTKAAVNQTGSAGMLGTWVVLAVLAAVFAAGLITVNRKRLMER